MARAKDTNRVDPKEVYNYLVNEKGVSREHALGMLANIQAESGFNSGAVGDNGTSGGLFQHHDSRFKALKEQSKGDWTNWKKQIDYALSEKATKNYLSKSFETPEQASEWFTINWEVPADKYNKAKQRVKNLEKFGWETSQNETNNSTSQEPTTSISEPLMEGDNTYLLQDPTLSEQEPLAIVTKDQIEEEISKLKHIEKQVAESPERQAIEESKKEMSKTLSEMGVEANIVDYAPQEDEPPVQQFQENLWTGYEIPQLQTQLPTLPNIFETGNLNVETKQYKEGGEIEGEPVKNGETTTEEFLKNWYENRVIQDTYIQEGFDLDLPYIKERLKSFPPTEIVPLIEKSEYGEVLGRYDAAQNKIFITDPNDKTTKLHEQTHYIDSFPSVMRTIHNDIVRNETLPKEQISDPAIQEEYEYFTNPDEVHARVMVLREAAGFKPDQFVTQEDMNNFISNYKGGDENINQLLAISKDITGLLNMLNYMASNQNTTPEDIA